ncbi:unnamed protein product [Microthlaspi erraticum]|uniref:DUF659 domain-containing protein n=1 Tax=Microthlaspi erraticum TaxID=1685480 RepID=A0A6D2HSJ8_9BRAS|nr:unnamed protein product [Microthlaspi erraticum]
MQYPRLRIHLGGVGKDVSYCDKVTFTVRNMFRDMLMKEKPGLTASKARRVGKVQMGNRHKRGSREDSSSKSVSSPEKEDTSGMDANKKELLSQKSIARFFYENCVDFSTVDCPIFREMMTLSGVQMGVKFPSSQDLNGWMLQEALQEVEDNVKKIKDLWKVTGCSILLDAWVDEKGRDLVAFVADCPAGPVYLKSFDVSHIKSNDTALMSLVDGLVEEVGVHNVVQIIAYSTSGWVGELGKSFVSNNVNVFWSVSVSHCFELMLVRIVEMYSFEDIVDKVNKITEFINSNPLVSKLVRDQSHGIDKTVSSSEFEFVKPYLSLESIFMAKNDLAAMFASSDWSKEEGKTMTKLMNDFSFWETVERVVKCTSPLIRGLLLFTSANNQHVGYIYDIMDGIKESIAKEFNHKEKCYKPSWDVIDDVWNTHLHSPLHVTGYFLNPGAFYSGDFHCDPEVTTGFISSLARMVKESHILVKVSTQLEMYRLGKGCFNEASEADEISEVSPAEWWGQKASQYPELQSFAIKVLSQTCEGASRYKLKRNLAEKLLLTEGRSQFEQHQLEKLAFVHYNLHLQSCKAKLSGKQ